MRISTRGPYRSGPALLLASLALALAACGTPAQPQGAPSPYVVASAAPMEPSGGSFTGTDDPASKAEPTLGASQARAAAQKFVTTSLSVGYPIRTRTDYLNRLKPLMTPTAFAAQQAMDGLKGNLSKKTSEYYVHRIRIVPRLKSAKVTTATDETATVTFAVQLTPQQQRHGKWSSQGQATNTAVTTSLRADGGTWLIDGVN